MKTNQNERFIIADVHGNNIFNKVYTEAAANRIWDEYNGIYTDDNGEEIYMYIEEVDEDGNIFKCRVTPLGAVMQPTAVTSPRKCKYFIWRLLL